MTSTDFQLDQLFGEALPTSSQGWRRFGFIENPFPSRAHPVWDVFVNQAQVRDRFYDDLKIFIREGITTTLIFTGGNRIGKTHFCEHHKMRIPANLSTRGAIVPVVKVSAESAKFSSIYRPIIDQIDDTLQVQTGQGLLAEAWRDQLPTILPQLEPGQFRQAIETLAAAADDASFAAAHSVFMQWLRGERIRLPQRRLLGVTSVIESLADELNAIQGILGLLRALNLEGKTSPGVILFVDEFELIWANRRDQRDRFLHALRALVDACRNGLFLCVAMAVGTGYQYGPDDVEREYPAFFARLKGHRDVPPLVQIPGVLEAQEYADAFIEFGRDKARKAGIVDGEELFTKAEIAAMFLEVSAGRGGSAPQGDFFDNLHTQAEARVSRSAVTMR